MQLNLEEYRKHPLFPFSDFRTNDASFLLLELFWTQVAREALGDELSSKVEPLMACERDNGDEPFYNPIMLDFWIPKIRRGAKIELRENYENDVLIEDSSGDQRFTAYFSFSAYLQKRGITGPDDEIDQIVFSSDLTNNAIKSVQNGLRAFLVSRIKCHEMEDMINNHFTTIKNYRY